MASFLNLSHELIHCILLDVDPVDLSAVSRTCRLLHAYIRGNALLHKEIYLRHYDEPRGDNPLDWEEETHRIVKLEKILQSEDREVKRDHLDFASDQISFLLSNAHSEDSRNIRLLDSHFSDHPNNLDIFLCSSSLFGEGGTPLQQPAATPALRQKSAKLHSLYGRPIEPVPVSDHRNTLSCRAMHFFTRAAMEIPSPPSSNTRLQTRRDIPAHMVARSKVYDLRQYTDATRWGPFTDDGTQTVDWEKVEAVMVVLGFSLNRFSERVNGRFPRVWDRPFHGASPDSYVSAPREPSAQTRETGESFVDEELTRIRELAPSIDSLDPYGVTGTWMRVVCFLDYNDLYAFNFSSAHIPDHEPREPIDTEEAIRLIRIKLQVTRIDPPEADDEDEEEEGMDWSKFQGKRLPIVHFRGTSRSLHASWDPNANSRIRGIVRQTPEGEIRWTTFSIFHGEERWRSEGVQVGGLRSARGVLGNWFDKDYDDHGPAGPTAFWKETDELAEVKSSSTPLAFF